MDLAAMTVHGWLILALWLTLVAYWVRSAGAVKCSAGGRWAWWREIAVRLGFFAFVVVALRVAVVGPALPDARLALDRSMLIGFVGFMFCALGIGLAILARVVLSRENPDLVTTGPYALVRHPIYCGMLLAMLGSAIGQSILWLLPLIVYGPFFVRSARREERILIGRFQERYLAYMKRTKMLLPFVL